MANKRIKDLSTTAAVTASDDFIAVDGATNGTRKLDAYSPTFGGNLTVSGTGTSTFAGNVGITNPANAYTTLTAANTASSSFGLRINAGTNTNDRALTINKADTSTPLFFVNGGGDATLAGNLTVSGGTITGGTSGLSLASGGTNKSITLTPTGTGFTVIQGVGSKTSIGDFPLVTSYAALYQGVTTPGNANYTVASNGQELVLNAPSGSYQIRFQVGSEVARMTSAGNLLLGTTTDGGQKLQVSGTAAITGALSIGNTVQTAASVASTHKVTVVIGGVTYYLLATNV